METTCEIYVCCRLAVHKTLLSVRLWRVAGALSSYAAGLCIVMRAVRWGRTDSRPSILPTLLCGAASDAKVGRLNSKASCSYAHVVIVIMIVV